MKNLETSNKNLTVVFRGRNTDGVLKDLNLQADDLTVVISREGDALAQKNDLTVKEAIETFKSKGFNDMIEKITLVANGGTTAQIAPFMIWLLKEWEGKSSIIEVERGGEIITHK